VGGALLSKNASACSKGRREPTKEEKRGLNLLTREGEGTIRDKWRKNIAAPRLESKGEILGAQVREGKRGGWKRLPESKLYVHLKGGGKA